MENVTINIFPYELFLHFLGTRKSIRESLSQKLLESLKPTTEAVSRFRSNVNSRTSPLALLFVTNFFAHERRFLKIKGRTGNHFLSTFLYPKLVNRVSWPLQNSFQPVIASFSIWNNRSDRRKVRRGNCIMWMWWKDIPSLCGGRKKIYRGKSFVPP